MCLAIAKIVKLCWFHPLTRFRLMNCGENDSSKYSLLSSQMDNFFVAVGPRSLRCPIASARVTLWVLFRGNRKILCGTSSRIPTMNVRLRSWGTSWSDALRVLLQTVYPNFRNSRLILLKVLRCCLDVMFLTFSAMKNLGCLASIIRRNSQNSFPRGSVSPP